MTCPKQSVYQHFQATLSSQFLAFVLNYFQCSPSSACRIQLKYIFWAFAELSTPIYTDDSSYPLYSFFCLSPVNHLIHLLTDPPTAYTQTVHTTFLLGFPPPQSLCPENRHRYAGTQIYKINLSFGFGSQPG